MADDLDEAREEQAAELEAIEAIFLDDFVRLDPEMDSSGSECARFHLDLLDIDAAGSVTLRLIFTLPALYPVSAAPGVVAHPLSGVSAPQRRALQAALDSAAAEAIGSPTIYLLVDAAKDFLLSGEVEEEKKGDKKDDDDEEGRSKFETLDHTQKDKVEIISSKAVGTPVTVETFARWREEFLAELAAQAGKQAAEKDAERGDKVTGRQYFESKSVVVTEESASFWETELSMLESAE